MSISSDEFREILASYHLQGYNELIIRYDGAGDSGSIDEIELIGNNGYNLKEDEFNIIEEAFDAFFMNLTGDWYNNDGGYGAVSIDLENGLFEIETNTRTIYTEGVSGSIDEL
jgi:hypothetical protein